MTRLVFPGESYSALKRGLLSFPEESCALLLAEPVGERLIVVERHPAPAEAYARRGAVEATLHPEFIVPIVKAARSEGRAVVFVHTHPGISGVPRFSSVDDKGEALLAEFMQRRAPGVEHVALVISPDGCRARSLGRNISVKVEEVGSDVRVLSGEPAGLMNQEAWDRQVRAFGPEGQARLQRLQAVIVGCGGTGSVVAQQLAHLGVGRLTLIDPDRLEATNLNRVVGATASDVGRPKVEVAADAIRRLGLGLEVVAVQGDVRDGPVARRLVDADAILCCTDSHSSRAVINQIAYQYVVPAFDVGVAIGVEAGQVRYVAGRAQMLAPGLACLVCSNTLDGAAIRQELQSDEARARDPYIVGHNEPQPAVISLNSTMASLLVTMFLSAFAGIPAQARLQFYDGLRGRVRPAVQRPTPGCIVCSSAGALAQANRWPFPARTP